MNLQASSQPDKGWRSVRYSVILEMHPLGSRLIRLHFVDNVNKLSRVLIGEVVSLQKAAGHMSLIALHNVPLPF